MTSVDFISAAAVWPLRSCISRTASAVMMEVIAALGLADFEDDLGQQAADLYLDDGADELIAAADVAEALARGFAGGWWVWIS